jgi:hypothetical protein
MENCESPTSHSRNFNNNLRLVIYSDCTKMKQNPWPQYASELYQQSDNRLSAKLVCTHEAEWTPFQTHYFSENLVVPGIELGTMDL